MKLRSLSIILAILLAIAALFIGCDHANPHIESEDFAEETAVTAEPTETVTLPPVQETRPDTTTHIPPTSAVQETQPADLVAVRFVDWTGKMIDTRTVERYDSVEIPGWLTCPTGYALEWTDEDGISYEADNFITAANNILLKAVLTPLPVQVEIVHDNRLIHTVEADYGTSLTLPEYAGYVPHGYYFGYYIVNGRKFNAGETVSLNDSWVQASNGRYMLTVKAHLEPLLRFTWTVTETFAPDGLLVEEPLYWSIPLLDTFSEDLFRQGYTMSVHVKLSTEKGASHCIKNVKLAMCDVPDRAWTGDEGFYGSVIGSGEQSLKRYGEFSVNAKVSANTLNSYKLNIALEPHVGYIFDGAFVKNSFYAQNMTIVVEFYK